MSIAVIDMGTNTFHLLIVDTKGQEFEIVHRERVAVKIGEKGINQGKITEAAEKRALATLSDFKATIEKYSVENVFATATSAIRNASNGHELVQKIAQLTGIETRVISGLEEARLIYYGVTKALSIGSAPSLIMDIGGGSIEFIIGTDTEILWKQSFEIGGQRLMELFQNSDPITKSDIESLKSHLDTQLEELFLSCTQWKPKTLIGSSGTFDTLSEIYQHEYNTKINAGATEFPLPTAAFEQILKELVSKNREERLQIKGMIPLRVDMIVVASLLIKYIMGKCSLDNIRVSAYALKEGVLLNTVHSLKSDSVV